MKCLDTRYTMWGNLSVLLNIMIEYYEGAELQKIEEMVQLLYLEIDKSGKQHWEELYEIEKDKQSAIEQIYEEPKKRILDIINKKPCIEK